MQSCSGIYQNYNCDLSTKIQLKSTAVSVRKLTNQMNNISLICALLLIETTIFWEEC